MSLREATMRSARAVRFASATTTSCAYSTPNISRTARAIRHACRADQNRKSSGSPLSSSLSSADPFVFCFVELGINDGSPSRHSGTTCASAERTDSKSTFSGRFTKAPIYICDLGYARREKKDGRTVYFDRTFKRKHIIFPVMVVPHLVVPDSPRQ